MGWTDYTETSAKEFLIPEDGTDRLFQKSVKWFLTPENGMDRLYRNVGKWILDPWRWDGKVIPKRGQKNSWSPVDGTDRLSQNIGKIIFDRWRRDGQFVPKRRQEITTTRSVITGKRAVLKFGSSLQGRYVLINNWTVLFCAHHCRCTTVAAAGIVEHNH